MKHLFVPYNLALELKEKGFNEPCFTWWGKYPPHDKEPELINVGGHIFENTFTNHPDTNTTAPLYQQVIDWFREKHKLHFYIETTPSFDKMQGNKFKVSIKSCFEPFKWTTGHYYLGDTYYEALDKAIEEALKLI